MAFDLVIRGGTAVLPDTDGVAADIAIAKGRIAAILAPGTAVDAKESLDVAATARISRGRAWRRMPRPKPPPPRAVV
jgi:hypothetical protein